MKPAKFIYHSPASIDEAVELLGTYAGDARVLAGGQSLIPMMNFRLAAPKALVDIGRIPSLSFIGDDGDYIRFGAMTRQRTIETSDLVNAKLPLLREAISWVGHLPTRSRGTIGGSISHADPATEISMVMQTLGGELTMQGAGGRRTLSAHEFYLGALQTAIAPDEILVEVRLPAMASQSGYAVEELARRHGDFAIVAIAAVVESDRNGVCTSVQLGAAGIGETPLRMSAAEDVLKHSNLSEEKIAEAADVAGGDAYVVHADRNGSVEYRRQVTRELTIRALRRAVRMARERVDG